MTDEIEIELDTSLSAARNASKLYELAKKYEKKAEKIEKVIEELKNKIKGLKKKKKGVEMKEKRERKWYEKFRWFISSTGKLVIGGRDAITNEILMKKYTTPEKKVFHADIAGAPFFVVFDEEDEKSLREAMEAAAIFSSAWKKGLGGIEVFWTERKNYTKEAPAGQYLAKGAFLVRGRKNREFVELRAAVGILGNRVMCGPIGAVLANCRPPIVVITPGGMEKGKVSKKIAKLLNADPAEVERLLPPGKVRIEKVIGSKGGSSNENA